jgi:lipopolysaccharide export system permease protein
LIYISYYMFSLGVKTSIGKGIFPVIPGVFIVPILYCLIFTVPFNITDTEWFNKLRAKRGIKRV